MKFWRKWVARLPRTCPNCGAENTSELEFCRACTASAPSTSQPAAELDRSPSAENSFQRVKDSGEVPGGERKFLTALFADISGSTALMQDLDPEDARAIIDPVLQIMIDSVQRYDGYVVQSTGDGIFALFGAPVAREDHSQRALYCALRMQEEIRRHRNFSGRQSKVAPTIRIGINSGEVVVRTIRAGEHLEYTPVGHTANLASRLQTLAPPGSIAISEDTRRLVEGFFELRSLGPAQVKGIRDPLEAYEVIGPGPLHTYFEAAKRRGLSKFVGREHELQQLRTSLDAARRGCGQVVAVIAEAGAGKSRLFHEFKSALPSGCEVLHPYTASNRVVGYQPVLELLRDYFEIEPEDDVDARRQRVRAKTEALDPASREALPYLFTFLGLQESPDPLAQMDAEIKRRRILDAIKCILVCESLKQPLILVFEDLQFIDRGTEALLDLLVEAIATARVLLLVNYRPEYRHNWQCKPYYTELRLDPLPDRSVETMLASLLGQAPELAPVKKLIIERTQGNPFFVEELVRALFEQGLLADNEQVKLQERIGKLKLPPSLQGVLASRIDRLPGAEKELLQSLAIIGRKASLRLIRQVVGQSAPKLENMLADLQRAEFLCEERTGKEIEYAFKHVLTQEVAYVSVLIERRKFLHDQTARAIEAVFATNLADHYSELAHHYSHSNNADKAIEYLQLAGEQASQRSANIEAIADFKAALKLLLTSPEVPERAAQELALQIAVGVSLQAAGGWAAPEVEHAYSRAMELCQQMGESPQLYPALFGLQSFHVHRAKLQEARGLAQRALKIAETLQDPGLLLEACHMLSYNLAYLGDLTSAREHAERGIALYNARYHSLAFLYGGDDPGVCCLCHRALVVWALGFPDQALKSVYDAVELARQLSHPLSLALALVFAAIIHQFRRERQSTAERATEAMSLSNEHGFPYFLAWGTILEGWALADQGQPDGAARMRDGLAAYHATGADSFRSYHLGLIADGHRALGEWRQGLDAAEEALTWTLKTRESFYAPELYRLKGMLTLHFGKNAETAARLPAETEAELYFQNASESARKQGAKSWELRVAISRARLLLDQGRSDQARTMLTAIYGWFNEGLKTADLKDARMLLDQD